MQSQQHKSAEAGWFGSRHHRLSTLSFILEGNEVPRVLIHLLSRILHRHGSWLETKSITTTVMSTRKCASWLKCAATGESSVLLARCHDGGHHDIAHKRTEDSPVETHFNHDAHSLSDMTVMVIDLVSSHDPCLHKIWESRWIRTLGTSLPSRMNLRVDSLWCLLPNWPASTDLCRCDCVSTLESIMVQLRRYLIINFFGLPECVYMTDLYTVLRPEEGSFWVKTSIVIALCARLNQLTENKNVTVNILWRACGPAIIDLVLLVFNRLWLH